MIERREKERVSAPMGGERRREKERRERKSEKNRD